MSSDVASPANTPADEQLRPRFHPIVRILLMEAVFLVAMGLTMVITIPLGALGQSEIGAAAVNAASCVIFLILVVLGTWLLMRYVDRRPMRETGWRWTRSSAGLLGIGLAISIILTVGFAFVGRALGVLEVVDIPWDDFTTTAIVVAVIAKLFQAFALQGITEELLYRGYLMQTLREHPKVALVVSTLVFGILHLVSAGGQENIAERFIYLLWPTGFGFCAAALLLRLRSLWVAVGIHAGSHVGGLILQFTGINTETPVAWVAVGLLYFAVGAAVLIGHKWETIRIDR